MSRVDFEKSGQRMDFLRNARLHIVQLDPDVHPQGLNNAPPKVYVVPDSLGKDGGNYRLSYGQTYTVDGGQTFKSHGPQDGTDNEHISPKK